MAWDYNVDSTVEGIAIPEMTIFNPGIGDWQNPNHGIPSGLAQYSLGRYYRCYRLRTLTPGPAIRFIYVGESDGFSYRPNIGYSIYTMQLSAQSSRRRFHCVNGAYLVHVNGA